MAAVKFVPTLQSLSCVRFLNAWLNHKLTARDDICYGYSQDGIFPNEFIIWSNFEKLFKEDLKAIILPASIKIHLHELLSSLYTQLWTWLEGDIYRYVYLRSVRRNRRCYRVWYTNNGRIDKWKMIEDICKMDIEQTDMFTVDLEKQFIEACHICCEYYITKIFGLLTEKQKESICFSSRRDILVFYWFSLCNFDKLSVCQADNYDSQKSVYENAWIFAISYKAFPAAEYFWHRLSDTEKKQLYPICIRFSSRFKLEDLLEAVLDSLTSCEKKTIYEDHAFSILDCFLSRSSYETFERISEEALSYIPDNYLSYFFINMSSNLLWTECVKPKLRKLLVHFMNVCSPRLKGNHELRRFREGGYMYLDRDKLGPSSPDFILIDNFISTL